MKVCATIEARMSSSRLPGKVMMKHDGQPMIKIMVDRVMSSRLVNDVIVATTVNKNDDELCKYLESKSINFYRGSEENVLKRVLDAAEANGADVIVELTGDCPLIDPTLIDQHIELYLNEDIDYVANTTITNAYPRGSDVQVFSVNTLRDVSKRTSDPDDLENVSLYIYRNPDLYTALKFPAPEYEIPLNARLTLDYKQDLDFINQVFDKLGHNCTLEEICSFLLANPDVMKINQCLGATYVNDDTRNS